MPKKPEVNLDVDFDDIQEVEKVEESDLQESEENSHHHHDTEEAASPKSKEDLESLIKKTKQQMTAYVDQRIIQVDDKIKEHSKTLHQHGHQFNTMNQMLTEQGEAIQGMQKSLGQEPIRSYEPNQKTNPASDVVKAGGNVIDSTLGTVGGVLHGVIDTAAFILESTVDLVTFGRAKRPQQHHLDQ